MPDRSFLDWPFFDDQHRVLAHELDDWATANLTALITMMSMPPAAVGQSTWRWRLGVAQRC